jgi:glycosyl transferase family 25
MLKLSHELGISFNFIDAVNGKDLSQDQIDDVYDESLSIAEIGRGLTLGELGCALSHLNIYKRMLDENIETAVILEDDIEITSDIHAILNAKKHYPEVWDILLLGYYSETKTERRSINSFWGKVSLTTSVKAVRLTETAFGTHGYMINIDGAKKLVSKLCKIIKPIDHYTGTEHYLNMYAASSRVITLDPRLKALGSIETDRRVLSSPNNNLIKNSFFLSIAWKRVSKNKITYWLKTLISRIFPVQKYINKTLS